MGGGLVGPRAGRGSGFGVRLVGPRAAGGLVGVGSPAGMHNVTK